MLRSEAEDSRWLWLILLLGSALRLFGLGQESLWLDEVITADRVHELLREILFGWDSETQGPLYYLWIKGWGLLFGTGEWTLRIWSVVFGTLTIAYVYALGRQLFSGTGALLAALFICVHPMAVHYSQEARPYALFLLLVAASYYYLLLLMRQHRWPLAITYILVTTAAFYTHAFGVFLLLSQLIMLRWFKYESRFRGGLRFKRPYLYTLMWLTILCLPEVIQNVMAAVDKVGGKSPASWIPVPTWNVLFKVPAEYFMDIRIGFVVLTVVGFLAIVRAVSEPQLRAGFKWLMIVGVCFWFVPWLISIFVSPVYVTRYTIPGLLVVIFLMSTAAASLQVWPRRLFVTFLVLATAFPLWHYFTKIDKDPWRQTAEYLEARVKQNDQVVCFPFFAQEALGHYLSANVHGRYVRPKDMQTLEEILAACDRLWIVTSYDTNNETALAQIDRVGIWGTELRSVSLNDMLDMNPYRFWSAPIKVALREKVSPPSYGPEPALQEGS